MERNCEIVRDLLPLYVDDVCSPASRELVENHLSGCPACVETLRALRSEETDRLLVDEKTGVLTRQARVFRRKSTVVGMVFASILMVPVLVCLIVNLASGHALDWFFIVLSALLVAASVLVVPLMVPKYRFPLTLAAFAASLLLLFGVCCLYSGGRWFFIASSATLFGLAVVLGPVLVSCEPLKTTLGPRRGTLLLAADTLLFVLMMTAIGFSVRSSTYSRLAFAFSFCGLLLVWALFAVCRWLPVRPPIRLGLVSVLLGAVFAFGDWVIGLLLRSPVPFPRFSPTVWNTATYVGNVQWLTFFGFLAVGILLAVLGLIIPKKEKQK